MHVSRSRLVAAGAALLVAGGILAAGSLASGGAPAASHRATALAQRTFVSAANGNDANPCTLSLPCRNFQAAIAQTASGGEVVVFDSGGYGTVNITQAVSRIGRIILCKRCDRKKNEKNCQKIFRTKPYLKHD